MVCCYSCFNLVIDLVMSGMGVISSNIVITIGRPEPMDQLYDSETLYAGGVHIWHEGLLLLSCERVFFSMSRLKGFSILGVTEDDGLPRAFWVSPNKEHEFPRLVACGVMQQQFIQRLRDLSRSFRAEVPLNIEPFGGDYPFELLVSNAFIGQHGTDLLAEIPAQFKDKVWVGPGKLMAMYS